jgi:hypothetical protein
MEIFNSKEAFAEWYFQLFEPDIFFGNISLEEEINSGYEDYLLNLQQQSLCRLNQGDAFLDEGKEWISLFVSHNELLSNPYLNVDSEGYYLFSGRCYGNDPMLISNYGKMMEPYCLLFL